MSLFLGKIHYWLFNKIKWFETLEKESVKLALENNLPADIWQKEAEEKYGYKTPNKNLDEIIDKQNIHGWLNSKIEASESRYAYIITRILEKQDLKNKLLLLYRELGKESCEEYKIVNEEIPDNPDEVYNALNDYLLDGMPCDKINEIVENDSKKIIWKSSKCIHKEFWEKENGDVKIFYDLRKEWIIGFVENLDNKYLYEELENGFRIIRT